MHNNAQYGETPLKKRKRKSIGKEKGRDNCHAFWAEFSPYCAFYGVPSGPSVVPGEFLARENPFETSRTDEPNDLLIQALFQGRWHHFCLKKSLFSFLGHSMKESSSSRTLSSLFLISLVVLNMVMISSVRIAFLVIEHNDHVTITWHNLRLKGNGWFVVVLKKQDTKHSSPRRQKKLVFCISLVSM